MTTKPHIVRFAVDMDSRDIERAIAENKMMTLLFMPEAMQLALENSLRPRLELTGSLPMPTEEEAHRYASMICMESDGLDVRDIVLSAATLLDVRPEQVVTKMILPLDIDHSETVTDSFDRRKVLAIVSDVPPDVDGAADVAGEEGEG